MKDAVAVRATARSQHPGSFGRLWTANAFSNLGDGIYQFALPLIALDLTRSPSLVSGVTLMLTLAWPVFGLHAGSVVDRFDRRAVLVAVSLLRLATLAILTAAIIGDGLSLPMLYLVALVLGIGETLADTGLVALVPATVGPDQLDAANGRIAAGQMVTNTFLGPPLAGALLTVGSGLATGVATALYGIAAGVLATLPGSRGADAAAHGERPGWGVTEGLRFLWRNPTIRQLTLFTAAMNVWWAAWIALFVLYAVAPGPLGLSPAGYSALVVAMAVGGIVGSLLAAPIGHLVGLKAALTLDLVGTTLLVGVPALTTNPLLVGAANLAAGVGSAVWVVLVTAIRQRLTPNQLLGRVYSASRLISWGVLPIGAALGGLAAEVVGVRTVFAAGALTSIALLVAFVLLVRDRDLQPSEPTPK
jgi:MFS family permease